MCAIVISPYQVHPKNEVHLLPLLPGILLNMCWLILWSPTIQAVNHSITYLVTIVSNKLGLSLAKLNASLEKSIINHQGTESTTTSEMTPIFIYVVCLCFMSCKCKLVWVGWVLSQCYLGKIQFNTTCIMELRLVITLQNTDNILLFIKGCGQTLFMETHILTCFCPFHVITQYLNKYDREGVRTAAMIAINMTNTGFLKVSMLRQD